MDLAVAFENNEQTEKAIETYRKAIEVDPTLAEGYYGLGMALASAELFEEALPLLNKAVELDPNHAGALLGISVMSLAMGQFDEGFEAFRRAAELEPENALQYYEHLESFLVSAGQNDTADRFRQEAQQLLK